MNTIKGLILKDLMNLKSYKTTMLFILVLYVIVSLSNEEMMISVPIYIVIIFGMIAIGSFNYDSMSKSDKYILSFPVTRKEVVKARYLYVFLFTLVGVLFSIGLNLIFQIIKTGNLNGVSDVISVAVGGFFGMILLQVFQIPIMYKFGAEKGKIIQMIMILAVMLGISGITVGLMKISNVSLEQLEIFLKNYGILLIGIVSVILYFISYQVSFAIYSKKEV